MVYGKLGGKLVQRVRLQKLHNAILSRLEKRELNWTERRVEERNGIERNRNSKSTSVSFALVQFEFVSLALSSQTWAGWTKLDNFKLSKLAFIAKVKVESQPICLVFLESQQFNWDVTTTTTTATTCKSSKIFISTWLPDLFIKFCIQQAAIEQSAAAAVAASSEKWVVRRAEIS